MLSPSCEPGGSDFRPRKNAPLAFRRLRRCLAFCALGVRQRDSDRNSLFARSLCCLSVPRWSVPRSQALSARFRGDVTDALIRLPRGRRAGPTAPCGSRVRSPLADPTRLETARRGDPTGSAIVGPPAALLRSCRHQKSLLALRKALWTKPMRWFGAAFVWLQHVSHGPFPDWFKLIILLFSRPVFQLSHFCFKRAYAISLLQMRLAGLDGLFERLQHDSLKLDRLGPERPLIPQIYLCLRPPLNQACCRRFLI
jgi:hypothetical protein